MTLTHRPQLPLCLISVKLTEDHRRLGRRIPGEAIARQLGIVDLIDHPDEGVAHLPERLTGVVRVTDRDRERDPLGFDRHAREVDRDLLVIALAGSSEVVPGVLHRAFRDAEVVEEDEMLAESTLPA
jgi:hypothetical protein